MDPKSPKTLEAFVRSFEEVASLVRQENPDCIIAPMRGAVPFVDVLNIIDGSFPNDKVEYVSASSIVHRRKEVLRGSFLNIIRDYDSPEGVKFLSLDEVISGNSLLIVSRQFHAARVEYANQKVKELYGDAIDFTAPMVKKCQTDIVNRLSYKSIGIVDTTKRNEIRKGGENKAYEQLCADGIVLQVETPSVMTMDQVDFFPAQYRMANDAGGKRVYLPIVDAYTASPAYIDFLKSVAAAVGKDPAKVTVQNVGKITESHKHVPQNLLTL